MEDKIIAAIEGQSAVTPPATPPVTSDPQDTASPTTPPSGQAENAPNLEGKDDWEYNGDVSKVPAQFQKFAKGLQKHFTQKSMTEAEIRRKGQEYDQFVTSEDFKAFQTWKQQSTGGQQATPQQGQEQNPTLISQNEWEEAQLDPTGTKAQGLIERVVQARLQQAVQQYGGKIQQIEQQQEMTRFNSSLSDYADANPDVLELHELGLMKPRLEEELASRKHATYESAINAAHQKAAQVKEMMKARLLQEQQQLVSQKREASINTGTSVGETSVVHVDKNDAFNTAFNNALIGKKVKNKLK